MTRRNAFKLAALLIPAGAALAWTPSAEAAASAAAAPAVNIELIDAVSHSLTPDFDAFAPGTARPRGALEAGGANVGPRIPLTRYDGDITIQDGQVVSGLDIYGRVTFVGPGVLRDCVVRGWRSEQYASLTSPVGLVTGKSFDLRGGLIEWCRIDATGRESLWANGISGGNYTARYCEITRVNDGISGVQIGNATVECCRIWNGYYTAWMDSSRNAPQSGWPASPSDYRTHGDAVQIHHYAGWVIRGCYLGGRPAVSNTAVIMANRDPSIAAERAVIAKIDSGTDFPNACLFVSVASTNRVGLLAEKNWFQGACARVNMTTSSARGDQLQGVTLRDNRFIRSDWSSPGFEIYRSADFQGTISGNVYDDNGAGVPVVTY